MRNYRAKSGYQHNWSKIPNQVSDVRQVKLKSKIVRFRRVKKSHKGLRNFVNMRRLFANSVDESFLDEISCLSGLTYLWMETVTAEDLSPLIQLRSLEYLIIRRVHRAKNFSFVTRMSSLRHLCMEHIKNLKNLEDLSSKDDLLSFGIEGSMDVTQKIDSLHPILNWKQLNSLYLTNTKILDGDLRCLGQLSSLRCLECARFYPKSEFDALRKCHPKLKCDWFNNYEITFS